MRIEQFCNFNRMFAKFLEDQNIPHPLDTARKLNVYKTLRRRSRRVLNVLCTFNLRPMSKGGATLWLYETLAMVPFATTA